MNSPHTTPFFFEEIIRNLTYENIMEISRFSYSIQWVTPGTQVPSRVSSVLEPMPKSYRVCHEERERELGGMETKAKLNEKWRHGCKVLNSRITITLVCPSAETGLILSVSVNRFEKTEMLYTKAKKPRHSIWVGLQFSGFSHTMFQEICFYFTT